MAISRPFLLALLGVVLLGATVFAVQNARNSATDSPAPAAQQQQQPADEAAPAAKPAPAGPEELLAAAFSSDVESASFDAKLTFRSEGERNVVQASGAFEDKGPREMPEVDLDVRVSVPSMSLDERGGFVTTGERAWFTRAGVAYAVPQSIWGKLAKARESGAQASSSESTDLDVDPRGWLRNVESEGTEQVDGVEATHISAEVDSAKAITEIVGPAAREAGSSVPLESAEQRLRQAGFENGELDVWVGSDKILRRVTLTFAGRGDANRVVRADFDFRLSNVNEPQDVARPAKVRPGMPGGVYGQFANGVLAGVAQNAGLDAEELNIGVPVTNAHLKADRAVADNKKVVIFFQNPRALDDKAVADSVRALDRRMKNVVVLTDDVRNVKRYGSLVEDLGVSQAPAIVIIGRSGQADLIEGYIDSESLVQVVAEAR